LNPGPPPHYSLPTPPLVSPVESRHNQIINGKHFDRLSRENTMIDSLQKLSLENSINSQNTSANNSHVPSRQNLFYPSSSIPFQISENSTNNVNTVNNAAQLPRTLTTSSYFTTSGVIKIKIYFKSDIFVIALASPQCTFSELLNKIERKIRLSGGSLPEGRPLKLRYRDEDQDLIQMYGDDDVMLALTTTLKGAEGEKGIVHIYVE
jgi:hypothetical protein